MSALTIVARHELRRMRRERGWLWLLAVFALMCAYAASNGRVWAAERTAALKTIAAENDRKRDEYFKRVTKAVAVTGQAPSITFLAIGVEHSPTLPTRPLASLALGQAEGYPYQTHFHALSKAASVIDTEPDRLANPATLLIGRFDLAFVSVFVLPLVLLASTFDLWTGERERGTSALLLAQPVNASVFLAGKLLARGLTMLLALTAIVIAALIAVTPGAHRVFGDLGLVGAAIGLYGLFWLMLAFAANVFTQRTIEAALACGILWLTMVVLMPAVLDARTDQLYPSPSRAELVNAVRLIQLQQRDRPRTIQTLAASSSCPAPGLDRTAAARLSVANIEADERELTDSIQRFETRQAKRRRFMERVRWWSPAIVLEDALERFSGNDADRALAFQQQAREFLSEWRQLVVSAPLVSFSADAEQIWHALPRFSFREAPAAVRLSPIFADLAAIALWSSILLASAWTGLQSRLLFKKEQDGAR